MVEVSWSRRSLLDLCDVKNYIAQSNANAADRISSRLQAAANSLSSSPNRARIYSGATRVLATVRPYLIFYTVTGDIVTIVTIRHSRRPPPKS